MGNSELRQQFILLPLFTCAVREGKKIPRICTIIFGKVVRLDYSVSFRFELKHIVEILHLLNKELHGKVCPSEVE